MNLNFLPKNRYRKIILNVGMILGAFLIFFGAFTIAYLSLGGEKLPGNKIWTAAAKVLPIPIANVNGERAYWREYTVLASQEVEDPLEQLLRLKAIESLAKQLDVGAGEQSLADHENILIARLGFNSQNQYSEALQDRNLTRNQFLNLYVKPDLLQRNIILFLSQPNEKVNEIFNRLNSGENFGELAQTFSEDQASAPLGGEIGFVSEDEVWPELWQEASVLEVGEWAGPIKSAQGYFFVKVASKQRGVDGEPDRLKLQTILIEVFDFETWLDEQMEEMRIRIYI